MCIHVVNNGTGPFPGNYANQAVNMSEELENEELAPSEAYTIEEDAAVETEEPEEPKAEAQEEKPHKVEFDEEQQKVFNDQISKKTKLYREEQRRAEELEKQVQELRAQIPQEQRPTIPEHPDPYDDDYEVKVRARDDALREAAAYDARQQFAQEQEQLAAQQKEYAKQQELIAKVDAYSQRATALGIDRSSLYQAGMVVEGSSMSQELKNAILSDEQGPLITTHLAANPAVLDDLLQTPVFYVGSKLDAIKANVAGAKNKQSSAPPPVETIQGNGVPETMPETLKGAIFE